MQSCKATLRHDTLIIANEYIARTFLWNGGNLITVNLWDKKNNQTWNWIDNNPDVSLPGHAKVEGKGSFEVRSVINQPNQSNHLETNYTVTFNMDVTAGRRNGYHFFNEYVSLFLENRYTDWVNYYPYCTLRNLWSLSRYLPAQKRSSISIAN